MTKMYLMRDVIKTDDAVHSLKRSIVMSIVDTRKDLRFENRMLFVDTFYV